ncbi:MAG: hypothetical protein FWD64_05355 [Acidobacteriaceae bacterium]|nr:hypothetical protein [Acidobacteriaceae bacterium]
MSPVIHCRTYQIDFRSVPLFLPGDIDAAFLMRNCHASTWQMMDRQIRHVVFAAPDHIVLGIVTTIEQLFQICGRTPIPEYCHVDKPDGRYACGFIGASILTSSIQADQITIPSPADFLDIYLKYIPSRWNEQYSDGEKVWSSMLVEYAETVFSTRFSEENLLNLPVDGKGFYHKSTPEFDWLAFQSAAYLSIKEGMQVSLCTDATFSGIQQGSFLLYTLADAPDNGWISYEKRMPEIRKEPVAQKPHKSAADRSFQDADHGPSTYEERIAALAPSNSRKTRLLSRLKRRDLDVRTFESAQEQVDDHAEGRHLKKCKKRLPLQINRKGD